MTTLSDYQSIAPAWCPGCGDFGILHAIKKALVALDKKSHEVLLCSGIGQAAKLPHYLRCNVFNGLHGRALPAAQAAKMVNPALTVLAIGGDGDMYGEGGNHFLHALRRNIDITMIAHNNKIYGLTKGQASPTTDQGVATKVQPQGVASRPINPLTLAISQNCGFVARGFSGRVDHLAELIAAGIQHRGFSLIDVLQPCVSFNKINTFAWYQARVYNVKDNPEYNPQSWHRALDKALEWGDRIPIGIIYKSLGKEYNEILGIRSNDKLVKNDYNKVLNDILKQFA
ncbi:MAG: thiamine pyrophosphate-dependent enzyme [candidate division FCPU426 bacterium]